MYLSLLKTGVQLYFVFKGFVHSLWPIVSSRRSKWFLERERFLSSYLNAISLLIEDHCSCVLKFDAECNINNESNFPCKTLKTSFNTPIFSRVFLKNNLKLHIKSSDAVFKN